MSRDIDALTSSTLKHLRERWWNPEFTEFLRETLAEGRQPTKEMQRRAADVGIKDRTLARARAQLGVLARSDRSADGRQVVGWFWELPR